MRLCCCDECADRACCALQVARQVKRSVTRRMLANNNATGSSNTTWDRGRRSPASPEAAAAAACETDTAPLTTYSSAVERGPEQEESTSSGSAVELPVMYKQVGVLETTHHEKWHPQHMNALAPLPCVVLHPARRHKQQHTAVWWEFSKVPYKECQQKCFHAWLAVTCGGLTQLARSAATRA